MNLRTRIASAVGAIALAGAVAYAPAATADRVGFNVTFGGPGYSLNVGNYGYYDHWRPAPVYVAPYTTYYQPYYYAPVVRPYPVYRHSDRHYGHRHGHRHDGYRSGHRGGHDRGHRGGQVGYVYHR